MKTIVQKQFLPISTGEAWKFFSSPSNLSRITPPGMKFTITSGNSGQEIYPGMIITYKVTPLPGLRVTWVTEISHVKEPEYFIDDQKSGPFRLWHHQHHFMAVDDGVEMTDIVTYAAPLGWLGLLAEKLVIGRRVRYIFEYRSKVMEDLFRK
jgi:ligand-binding SRPBCC domain-containing protein